MTKDIIFYSVCVMYLLSLILDFLKEKCYKHQIAELKQQVKAWGDCAYVCGYHDGLNNKPKQPPVPSSEPEKTEKCK